MLDNTISLSVDVLNDGNPTSVGYQRFEEQQNRSLYVGANHTLSKRDHMACTRGFPTKTGNFPGVAKSSVKFTEDIDINGVDQTTTITSPLIGTISFSLPVGTTPAQALALRQRMIAAMDDDTFMSRLTEKLEV